MTSPAQFHVDFLKGIIDRGGRIESARFTLQRDVLKPLDPVYVLTLEQNNVRSLQELPWSAELESLLLERRVRAASANEEAERFAAILLNNLETAEVTSGKDYARSVFVEIVRERPFYSVSQWLAKAATHRPSRTSKQYSDLRLFLTQSLDGLQNTALLVLGYTPDETLSLMSTALGIVLDELFHITARQFLFPHHGDKDGAHG